MQVAVIGLGRVGKSVRDLFVRSGHDVVAWDRESASPYPVEELARCDFSVVCVDTPSGRFGSADLSNVESAIKDYPGERIMLKSTVPPGSTEKLARATQKRIVFWPEYVGESSYHNPYFASEIVEIPFVIVGGPSEDRRWFIDRLLPVLGPTKRYFQCSSREAEIIKYVENAYFATKITFVNEMRRVADALGADWHTVREGWLLDPRIEPLHTAAFDDNPGFAGKCLPKDLSALVHASLEAGYEPAFLEEVVASNVRFRMGHDRAKT